MSFSILSGPIPSHRTSFHGVSSPFGLFALNSSGKEAWRKRMRSGVEDDTGACCNKGAGSDVAAESNPAADPKQEIKQEENDEDEEALWRSLDEDDQEDDDLDYEEENEQDKALVWPDLSRFTSDQKTALVGALISARKESNKR